eukprot:TRINITY_DN1200_c4_g1_i1.p1 TRINITY_DN1200_c4_g1~~TRINITY_DN1200_c4_g1_i1.p1  ORF type:complete len:114 (+),score=34.66 TRINITY_DN1200_c4_g1_i1:40-381(+)
MSTHSRQGIQSIEDLFKGLGEIAQREVSINEDDLKLLGNVNNLLLKKYSDMSERSDSLQEAMITMLKEYQELQPYFAQIDSLEISLSQLEGVVDQLDAYSAALEQRVISQVVS